MVRTQFVYVCVCVWVAVRVRLHVLYVTGERMTACISATRAQHADNNDRTMTYEYAIQNTLKDKNKLHTKKKTINKQIILTANSQPLNKIKIT